MNKILVLHGPNLNLLGTREKGIYGATNLESINQHLLKMGKSLQYEIICKQNNAEHQLIETIHRAPEEQIKFLIFNPGAFTHTSIALRDALLAVQLPFIEVHLSNIFAREAFRHVSYFTDIAVGSISGLGPYSYVCALNAAHYYLHSIEKGNREPWILEKLEN